MQQPHRRSPIAQGAARWSSRGTWGVAAALVLLLAVSSGAGAQGVEVRPVAEPGDGWQAGLAAVEVTPGEGTSLAGAVDTRGRLATGVEAPLHARAVVLADARGQAVILIALDLRGLFSTDVEEIRRRVSRGLAIEPHRIIVTTTQNYSGPDALGPWGGWTPEARRRVLEGAVEAARAAVDDVEVVTAAWQVVELTELVASLRQESPAAAQGLVLRLERADGSVKGQLVHVPARAAALSPDESLLSPDYPGHLAGLLEEEAGGTVVVVPGLGGDQQPRVDERGPGAAEAYALQLVARLGEAAAGEWNIVPADRHLFFRHLHVELPVTNWRLHAMVQTGRLDRRASHGRIQPQMAAFSMGSLIWMSVPGEGFAGLVEAWSTDERVIVPMGPANDYAGPLVPQDQYVAGGAEERSATSRHAAFLVERAGAGLLLQLEGLAAGESPRPEQIFQAMAGVMYIVPSRSLRLADEAVYSRAAGTQRRVQAVFYGSLALLTVGAVLLVRRLVRPRGRRPRPRRRQGGKVVQGPRPVRREGPRDGPD